MLTARNATDVGTSFIRNGGNYLSEVVSKYVYFKYYLFFLRLFQSSLALKKH
jgi:hypothetical protein